MISILGNSESIASRFGYERLIIIVRTVSMRGLSRVFIEEGGSTWGVPVRKLRRKMQAGGMHAVGFHLSLFTNITQAGACPPRSYLKYLSKAKSSSST